MVCPSARLARALALGWVLPLTLLAACTQDAIIQKFTSPEEQATAKQYIEQLQNRDFSEIEHVVAPAIAGPTLESTLTKMADLLPAGPPTSIQLVGAHRMSSLSDGSTTVDLTFEYRFGDRLVLADLATKTTQGKLEITNFHIQPEAESLATRNRFTLAGRTPLQYIVLVYAVLVALFTLGVLVACIRTPIRRGKWVWIIFILLGLGKFSVNWATGQWRIELLAVQVFSAGSYADLFGPWIISVSMPLGAIWFLFSRRRLQETAGVVREAVAAAGAADA
jgi:hypothetical protein